MVLSLNYFEPLCSLVVPTYRSCAIDNGGDSRQGPGIAFKALVGPLGSQVRNKRQRRRERFKFSLNGMQPELDILTKSADTAVVIRAYGPLTRPPHTSSITILTVNSMHDVCLK